MTEALFHALARLDALLQGAASRMLARRPGIENDRFRGLYVGPDDVDDLLSRVPGEPDFAAGSSEPEMNDREWAASLRNLYPLSDFDTDALLIALAPELDLRYERLYAFLQDDVTRRRPTVDLVLNLLCRSAGEKVERRSHFAPDAPLAANELVRLISDPSHVDPPLLSQSVKPDELIVSLVTGQTGLDPRLAPYCRYVDEDASIQEPFYSALAGSAGTLRLYFQGPDRSRKLDAACQLAAAASSRLLAADFREAPPHVIRCALREAGFRRIVLFAEGVESLAGADHGIVIVSGENECSWPGALVLRFDAPGWRERAELWRRGGASERDAPSLARRFVLTTGQIADAAENAVHTAVMREGAAAEPCMSDFSAAARLQTGQALAKLTRRINPRRTWNDIVLPEDVRSQLRELCTRAALNQHVLEDWGFGRTLTLGKGVTAMFSGPSGTGKTLAAEIVAHELEYDLYRIDLASVVSKYIGETEKNLDRIFAAAENANAILFFDEAEALFGKRSEIRDSHDRYANIEIAYLLQKMEEFCGVAILATNLRQNMDESFTRRLAFLLHFPFPDETSRLRIWQSVWPDETPLAQDLNLNYLARRFKLSGGNIRNVALAAAFLAAEESIPVGMDHLMRAIRREYQKLGMQVSAAELMLEAAS